MASPTDAAAARGATPPERSERPPAPLAPLRAGGAVWDAFGIVRAAVPFHGEHDAQEPTKVKRGQGGGRASALAPEL